jgi:hypothetical protein
MNETDPITQAQMFELMQPIYNVIAGLAVIFVFTLAFYVVVYPFINRRIR